MSDGAGAIGAMCMLLALCLFLLVLAGLDIIEVNPAWLVAALGF